MYDNYYLFVKEINGMNLIVIKEKFNEKTIIENQIIRLKFLDRLKCLFFNKTIRRSMIIHGLECPFLLIIIIITSCKF